MGFLDQLKTVADGVKDIFTAPVGLVVDTAKAITSDKYNPGFFGTFNPSMEQAVTGLSKVGEGLGATQVGEWVGQSSMGDTVREFFNQAELIYSSEFQRQQGRAPLGLPTEPGELSLQRIGAAGLGAVSESLAEGQTDFGRQWEKASHRTPGQAWIEEMVGFDQRPPEEREQIKASAYYNLTSGAIDAVGRWFTDPGVLAGKGVRGIRRRMAFRPGDDIAKAAKSRSKSGHRAAVRKMGYQLGEELDPVDGMPMTTLKPGRNKSVYAVVRNSMMGDVDTGPRGVVPANRAIEQWDELPDDQFIEVYHATDPETAARFSEEGVIASNKPGRDPRLATGTGSGSEGLFVASDPERLGRLSYGAPTTESQSRVVAVAVRKSDLEVPPEAASKSALPPEVPQALGFTNIGAVIRGDIPASRVRVFDPDNPSTGIYSSDEAVRGVSYPDEAVDEVRQFYLEQGIPEQQVESVVQETLRLQALDDVNARTAAGGIETPGQPSGVRFPGTAYRPIQLLAADQLDEAKRYASALYEHDPTDMPVIVRLNADDLPVGFEEIDMPHFPTGERPQDAAFFTLADQIDSDRIDEVMRLEPNDLDTALGADFEPATAQNPRLYNPDGSPVEPDQVISFEELRDDMVTASELAQQDPVEAEKFLLGRQAQRNGKFARGRNFAERAANHKQFQAYINWMDGKPMDEIRRVLFPNTPFGDIIANWLADASSYSERRTILLASMGYKIDDWGSVSTIQRAKLDRIARETENLANGGVPDETINAMMGLPSRYSDDVALFRPELVDELTSEIEDQAALNRFLDKISDEAPVRQLQMPVMRRAGNIVRRTSWYQQSSLARPIRNVIENRPHQWINVKDAMSDRQVVRQLEEAQPLGIDRETIENFRSEYAMAGTEQARNHVLDKVDNYIIERAAKHAGLSFDEFEEALRRSREGTSRIQDFLESRKYAGGNRDMWYDPDTGEMMRMPLLSTQLQSWRPMPNAREIVRIAKKMGKIKTRIGEIPRELVDTFYQIWKPTVLLRGGWMIRVVSDEQLRILARNGSLLTHIAAIATGDTPKFSHIFEPKDKIRPGQRAAAGLATATGTQPATSAAVRGAKAVTHIARRLGLVDEDLYKYMEDVGAEGLVSARATFGGAPEQTLRDLQSLLGRDEMTLLDHLYDKGTGQWRTVVKGDREYAGTWRRVLAEQYGRDPLGRKITEEILKIGRFGVEYMDDAELATVVRNSKKWLKDTAEGREVAERVPWRSRDPEGWIEDLVEEINGYTGGFDEELLRGIMSQNVTDDMLSAIDEAWRPDAIHGEIVSQSLGNSVVTQFIRDFVSEGFDLMGRLPTDTLSRQPMFRQLYAGEMRRLEKIRSAQGLEIDEDAIARMDRGARQYAINEVKEYLYDLAEVSRFGHMMRGVMPFYPAWQEVLKVWGKLAIEDPSVIARGKILWEAPNKANMVFTDDEGEEWLQFRLSEKTADKLDLTGWQRYLATGGLRFGKSSFNLVLNSPIPGVGPLIQYPVSEVVKKKPELEESLHWLLPFGVSSDPLKVFASPLIRQVQKELAGPRGDLSYKRAFADALTWMDVEYRAGRRTAPPTEEEAHDIAQKLDLVRLFARLGSPAQPIFDSPLEPYINAYRDMIENLGPEDAGETFLNEFGNEFFAVTLSRTVSKTGIPPTAEAEVARREYQDLIDQYPEYGRLIIGDKALGEFSTAAFAAQLERPTDPDNPFSDIERTYRPVELDPRTGRIMEVDRRLGWQEYINALDVIDLERKRLGLPNLRVAEAEHLAEAKRAYVSHLRDKYPAWYEDFNTQDRLKWDKRLEAMRALTNNSVLQDRPDIQGLETYLETRSAILQELNRRKTLGGASTLDATSNQDLAILWETLVFQILEDNVAFGPLYYRYLEGDPLRLGNG